MVSANFQGGRTQTAKGRQGMGTDKVETIRSFSSGTLGRAVSEARGARLPLDSPSRPQPDAFTNSEAFLAAVSSCGVTRMGHRQCREIFESLRRRSVG